MYDDLGSPVLDHFENQVLLNWLYFAVNNITILIIIRKIEALRKVHSIWLDSNERPQAIRGR